MKFTAVFRKVPEGHVAFVEELPGANTRAPTLKQARRNLKEAVAMVFEANRTLAKESLSITSRRHRNRQGSDLGKPDESRHI
jgi:predicted RNase H-like HicB family nuclease